jgi:pimeloyl-ACP methyl ester carboxylesterase/flagellar biosynthesis GTPase FlhF
MTSHPHGSTSTQQQVSCRGQPPPLPPRFPSVSGGVQAAKSEPSVLAMSSHDPRSSSTQSLVPDPAVDSSNLRRVLLVYIHGFMGNETSFRSFPAHVHNLVTVTLADTHVVHTKLYPRYQSRNTLEHARDNFSNWYLAFSGMQSAQLTNARLAPHEDQWTDVILLGHSMGGLLAADIALVFRHRIVGVINFDVPFLGMHPGIIKAGLGSIFSPPPAPVDALPSDQPEKKPSRIGTLFNPKPDDPNFNPSFHNDVQLPVRKGWENTLHWLNKHYSNGLRQATKGLVKSHFEFGSAMADYKELKDRYARVRALEEDDEKVRKSANPGIPSPPRIRFINYYTVSTGRPKKPKSPKSQSPSRRPSRELRSHNSEGDTNTSSSQLALASLQPGSALNSPRISVEVQEHRENDIVPVTPQEPLSATSPVDSFAAQGSNHDSSSAPDLPEIPPIPQEPPFVDLMQFTDKQQRKAAEKEHDRALKEYQKAVKTRNKVIKERTKAEEKWTKQKEQQKEQKEQQNEQNSHQQQEERRLQQEKERMEKERIRLQGGQPNVEKSSESTEDSHPSTDMHIGYEMRPEEAPEIQALDEDLGTMELGDSPHHNQSSNHPYANYDFSRSAILNQATPQDQSSMHESSYTLASTDSNASHPTTPDGNEEDVQKKKKLKKFCMLPPKDSAGNQDPTWVRVFMRNMDEVTAHTSLFFMNETYERLVGDVGAKIEDWIREADSMRLVREMQERS